MRSNILLVDDETSVYEHVKNVLGDLDYEVNGIDGPNLLWEILDTTPIDLILLDISMPEADGLTVLKQIKTNEKYKTTPVIMLTGMTDELIFTESFELGAFDYIYKPIHDVVLKARVRSALGLKKAFQQRQEDAKALIETLNVSMASKIEEISQQFLTLAKIHTKELTENHIEQIQNLEKISLFKGLSPFDLRIIAQELNTQSIEANQALLIQGEEVKTIYFIKEGVIDILINEDRVAQRGSGDSLGEMSCFSENSLASATARTVTPSLCWSIDYEPFLKIIDRIPLLRSKMFDNIIERFRNLSQRFSEILKHIPHGIIKIDAHGIITEEFSSRCADYLGISQLKGKDLGLLLFSENEERQQNWKETIHSLGNEGIDLSQKINSLPSEVIYKHPNGDSKIFNLFYYTILDDKKQLIGLDIGFDDITEKTLSQHELTSFKNILGNLEQLFILFEVESGVIIQETITNSQLGRTHFPHWEQLKGKSLTDLISCDQDAIHLNHFQQWLKMLENPFCLQTMPHEELLALAPTFSFETAIGQVVELSFTLNSVKNRTYTEVLGQFQFIEDEQTREDSSNHSIMILMEEITVSETEFQNSLLEALNEMQVSLEAVQEQSRTPHSFAKNQQEVCRLVHSVKGLAQSFKIQEIADAAHRVEDVLQIILKQGQAASTYETLAETLHSLQALIVVSKSLCHPETDRDLGRIRNHPIAINMTSIQFKKVKEHLSHLLNTCHSPEAFQQNLEILKTLNQEVSLLEFTKLSIVFPRLQHIIEDTSSVLKKQIQFHIHSLSEIYMKCEMASTIHNCLIQLVKNAVYHGIETKKERQLLKKSESGLIELLIEENEKEICITVRDDGNGLNIKKILNRAIELKVLSSEKAQYMQTIKDLDAILQLIFIPGFSTSSSVSLISGRGIGMDMIKTGVEQFEGQVSIESDEGYGTAVHLKLPKQNEQIIIN